MEGEALQNGQIGDRVSDAVVCGAIQIPPSGQPIILSKDQTVGGYPIIAVVASVDFPLVAQLAVKQKVKFERISIEESQKLRAEMESFLDFLTITIGKK